MEAKGTEVSWFSRHAEKPQYTVDGGDAAYWFARCSDERRAVVGRDRTISLNIARIAELTESNEKWAKAHVLVLEGLSIYEWKAKYQDSLARQYRPNYVASLEQETKNLRKEYADMESDRNVWRSQCEEWQRKYAEFAANHATLNLYNAQQQQLRSANDRLNKANVALNDLTNALRGY